VPARLAERLVDTALAIILFALMVSTCIDVVGRYFFNSPLPGANELGQLMMALLVYLGLPGVTQRREHIAVGLFEKKMTPQVLVWRNRIYGLVGVAVLLVVAWQLWRVGEQLAIYGDTTTLLRWPMAPFAFACAAFAGLAGAVQLAVTLRGGATIGAESQT
jgi:TRAP-type C4-dicarboxylate transport system permease small subunit